METTLEKTIKEYPGHQIIEPGDLISFTQEYLEHVPKLLEYVQKNMGKYLDILFIRLQHDGSFRKKTIKGIVKLIEGKRFIFSTHENMEGGIYEAEMDLLIRTDNVLGMVPLIPGTELVPFNEEPGDSVKGYLLWLSEVRDTIESLIGTKHSLTLFWRYGEENKPFRDGNYRTEGEVLKVNKSNLEYFHYRTFTELNGEYPYVDIIPREEIDRFIAPDRYLWRIEVSFGVEHQINPYDDED